MSREASQRANHPLRKTKAQNKMNQNYRVIKTANIIKVQIVQAKVKIIT